MNGLVQSLSGIVGGRSKCERCGATTRLGEGTCVNCLLAEGLEAEQQASVIAFESVLAEADVPDRQWRLGNYEILEEIGRGGMGVIYRARQRHSRRLVALKRVLTYHADSHETFVRFRREAEAAASLDHPNVLPIYEVSESDDGLPFFSMKLATGGSLRTAASALRSHPRECVRLMAKVARAIEYAHAEGILHRDLQPGNVLLDGRGEPMVSDFGLAKWLDENSDLTRTLTTFGTPGYIAPEQAECAAAELTPAVDIYSLGAILFHLLAGRPPFVGANVLSVIHQAAVTPAPRLRSLAPSLDRDLETIVARSLERDPQARYQSAGALAEDLERWLEGRPILARPVRAPLRIWRWARRNPILASAAAICFFLTAAVIWLLSEQFAHTPELPPPEKSIAVLPFENLSGEKDDDFFADGIQDDVLTSVGKIKDLKVIARASVMGYRGIAVTGRLREIGQTLGVAHVLQGSVKRLANRVVVNVALIDTRDERQVWAERYERTLTDSLSLQGELAVDIARALHATLTPAERTVATSKPTENPEAYLLYLRAREVESSWGQPEGYEPAIKFYEEAIALDPSFALARARLSIRLSQDTQGKDPTRNPKARSEAEEALRLHPDLGEARLALASCLFWIDHEPDRALSELSRAAELSPNSAEVPVVAAFIYKWQNKWRERIAALQRAETLDPLNTHVLRYLVRTLRWVRDWPEAIRTQDRLRALLPADQRVQSYSWRANDEFRMTGDIAVLKKAHALDAGAAAVDRDRLNAWRFETAILERDYAAAAQFLGDVPAKFYEGALGPHPKFLHEALLAVARGDDQASVMLEAARQQLETELAPLVNERSVQASDLRANLALIDAFLGRKEEALRRARHAVELETGGIEKNDAIAVLALVCAQTGEAEEALTLTERSLAVPLVLQRGAVYNMTLADLKWRWVWDPLRSNPRFQELLAGPEPKTVLTASQQFAPAAPEKSIAVLPFENLSDDKQNAYFAAGVQDEVLSNLARIADLKVISRTSVMQYKSGAARNLRAIGQALGVAHVLEGSVQRSANRVRVNAQLIDARSHSRPARAGQ